MPCSYKGAIKNVPFFKLYSSPPPFFLLFSLSSLSPFSLSPFFSIFSLHFCLFFFLFFLSLFSSVLFFFLCSPFFSLLFFSSFFSSLLLFFLYLLFSLSFSATFFSLSALSTRTINSTMGSASVLLNYSSCCGPEWFSCIFYFFSVNENPVALDPLVLYGLGRKTGINQSLWKRSTLLQ